MKEGTQRVTTRPEQDKAPARSRPRFGILSKLIVFMAALLIPLVVISWTISDQSLRANMRREFTSKGAAVAKSLAGSWATASQTRDASALQTLVDQAATISGVAYVFVHNPEGAVIAHSFSPLVARDLIEKNVVPGDVAQQVRDIQYVDPVSGAETPVIDIGIPVLAGQLGTVRVGMSKAIISAAASKAGRFLLLVVGGFAGVAVLTAVVFARRITDPVARLMSTAKRVGQGDLSKLVPVTSHDEIGELVTTFNDSIVRLRSQVQTEAERDEERRKREELQRNITRFLNTVMEISQGDLTKRGVVTSDVLGNVVDAINLMVEELATIIAEVRQAALRVAVSSREMIGSAGQMSIGAQAQSREVISVSSAVEELTLSVRQVAKSAEASAIAARQALEAAQNGDEALRNSLEAMQRIRVEVQTSAKRIRSLGDRSLEISDIVNTSEEIASQTNLLAVNAAIEAAGAGEAGLRFAVVADEVRKLAERSAKATKDIAALIKSVQAETQEAIAVTERATSEVESGYRVTIETGKSLTEIADIAQSSAKLAQDISRATHQQVRAAESVGAAVQSIAGVAVQTEQGVVHTRKTVEELVQVAEELTSSLSRFKLAA